MTVMAVQLMAWNSGRGFGCYHIEQDGGPLCQAVVPKAAKVSRTPGLLSVDDLCRSCLKAFSLSEESDG